MARKDLYLLLVNIASKHDRISYGDVSKKLADHPDHRTGLSAPLDELNIVCKKANLPPISALVVQKGKNGQLGLPGIGFWRCSAVAPTPEGELKRLEKYTKYIEEIYNTKWPTSLVGLE